MYGREWAKHPDREGKLFAHDVYGFESYPYAERYRLLQQVFEQGLLPENFVQVRSYPMSMFHKIWDEAVVKNGFEGVVFRRFADAYSEPILKLKATDTDDLYIVAFHGGDGKYSDTLGALGLARTPAGEEVTRCSGMTDSERDEIWQNQSAYMGRCVEVVGSQRSDSGLLQHPRFSCFRPDKD
jgi:ATP-dependent DNA ligase